jgi:hypothetical protein
MYLRTIRGSTQPSRADEFARDWEASLVLRIGQVLGRRRIYLGVDHATDTVLSVAVWDAPPDEVLLARSMQEFQGDAALSARISVSGSLPVPLEMRS